MPNENVQLKKGLSSNLPSTYTPGNILFETDTGNMYVDVTSAENSSQRVQVKDDTKLPLTGGTLTGNLNLNNHKIINLPTPTLNTDATNKSYVDGLYTNLESEIVTTAAQYLPLKGGTMTGVLDMGNNYIENLEDPQSNDQAANKGYVDTQVATKGDFKADGSVPMTGTLQMNGQTIRFNPQGENESLYNASISLIQSAGGVLSLNAGNAVHVVANQITMNNGTDSTGIQIHNVKTPTSSTDAANKSYVDTTVANKTVNWDNVDGKPFSTVEVSQEVIGNNKMSLVTSLTDGSYKLLAQIPSMTEPIREGVSYTITASSTSGGSSSVTVTGTATRQILSSSSSLLNGREAIVVENSSNRIFCFLDAQPVDSGQPAQINSWWIQSVTSSSSLPSSYLYVTITRQASDCPAIDATTLLLGSGLKYSGNSIAVDTSELVIDDGSLS